jgi:hypothetical protein
MIKAARVQINIQLYPLLTFSKISGGAYAVPRLSNMISKRVILFYSAMTARIALHF